MQKENDLTSLVLHMLLEPEELKKEMKRQQKTEYSFGNKSETKKERAEIPDSELQDSQNGLKHCQYGDLLEFYRGGNKYYAFFCNKNTFLPLKPEDIPLFQGNSKRDDGLVAIYRYPETLINELFWDGEPNEAFMDKVVWRKKDDLQTEIESLERRLKALKEKQAQKQKG